MNYLALKSDISRWGVARAIHTRIMQRLDPYLVVWRVHVRNLIGTKPRPPIEGIAVRIANGVDLLAMVSQHPLEISQGFVDAASERGDLCVAGFEGDRVVAFVWRSFSIAPFQDGLWLRITKPYRYGYKAFTDADYRGRGIQDRLSMFTDEICVERGFTEAVSLVTTHNYASIRSDMKRGNVLIGFVVHSTILGQTRVFRSPGAKKHKVELFEAKSE